jgi:hypothetical protein
MPTVNRLSNSQPAKPKPAPKAGGIWDRVMPVSHMPVKGRTFCNYGETKTGKTRFFASFPKPALLIGTEDGTTTVQSVDGLEFVCIHKAEELDELVAGAAAKGFKSVGLDHGGGYQRLCVKYELGLDDLPVKIGWGVVTDSQWGAINSQFIERVGKLLRLSETAGIHVMVIAHERVFKGKDSGRESDVISPTAGPALTPGCCGWLNGTCNYIVQSYKRAQIVKEDVGGVMADRRTGKYEYCLRVGPDESYMTGFRLDRVEDGANLPQAIVNPSFSKVEHLIRTGRLPEPTAKTNSKGGKT